MAQHDSEGDAAREKVEAYWREYLEQGESYIRFGRHLFSALPTDPRCRMCTAPFAGLGAPLMRAMGRRPSEGNPNVCSSCQNYLIRYKGGAEVEATLLFADIRGSTTLGEQLSPVEFQGAPQSVLQGREPGGDRP